MVVEKNIYNKINVCPLEMDLLREKELQTIPPDGICILEASYERSICRSNKLTFLCEREVIYCPGRLHNYNYYKIYLCNKLHKGDVSAAASRTIRYFSSTPVFVI